MEPRSCQNQSAAYHPPVPPIVWMGANTSGGLASTCSTREVTIRRWGPGSPVAAPPPPGRSRKRRCRRRSRSRLAARSLAPRTCAGFGRPVGGLRGWRRGLRLTEATEIDGLTHLRLQRRFSGIWWRPAVELLEAPVCIHRMHEVAGRLDLPRRRGERFGRQQIPATTSEVRATRRASALGLRARHRTRWCSCSRRGSSRPPT